MSWRRPLSAVLEPIETKDLGPGDVDDLTRQVYDKMTQTLSEISPGRERVTVHSKVDDRSL